MVKKLMRVLFIMDEGFLMKAYLICRIIKIWYLMVTLFINSFRVFRIK